MIPERPFPIELKSLLKPVQTNQNLAKSLALTLSKNNVWEAYAAWLEVNPNCPKPLVHTFQEIHQICEPLTNGLTPKQIEAVQKVAAPLFETIASQFSDYLNLNILSLEWVKAFVLTPARIVSLPSDQLEKLLLVTDDQGKTALHHYGEELARVLSVKAPQVLKSLLKVKDATGKTPIDYHPRLKPDAQVMIELLAQGMPTPFPPDVEAAQILIDNNILDDDPDIRADIFRWLMRDPEAAQLILNHRQVSGCTYLHDKSFVQGLRKYYLDNLLDNPSANNEKIKANFQSIVLPALNARDRNGRSALAVNFDALFPLIEKGAKALEVHPIECAITLLKKDGEQFAPLSLAAIKDEDYALTRILKTLDCHGLAALNHAHIASQNTDWLKQLINAPDKHFSRLMEILSLANTEGLTVWELLPDEIVKMLCNELPQEELAKVFSIRNRNGAIILHDSSRTDAYAWGLARLYGHASFTHLFSISNNKGVRCTSHVLVEALLPHLHALGFPSKEIAKIWHVPGVSAAPILEQTMILEALAQQPEVLLSLDYEHVTRFLGASYSQDTSRLAHRWFETRVWFNFFNDAPANWARWLFKEEERDIAALAMEPKEFLLSRLPPDQLLILFLKLDLETARTVFMGENPIRVRWLHPDSHEMKKLILEVLLRTPNNKLPWLVAYFKRRVNLTEPGTWTTPLHDAKVFSLFQPWFEHIIDTDIEGAIEIFSIRNSDGTPFWFLPSILPQFGQMCFQTKNFAPLLRIKETAQGQSVLTQQGAGESIFPALDGLPQETIESLFREVRFDPSAPRETLLQNILASKHAIAILKTIGIFEQLPQLAAERLQGGARLLDCAWFARALRQHPSLNLPLPDDVFSASPNWLTKPKENVERIAEVKVEDYDRRCTQLRQSMLEAWDRLRFTSDPKELTEVPELYLEKHSPQAIRDFFEFYFEQMQEKVAWLGTPPAVEKEDDANVAEAKMKALHRYYSAQLTVDEAIMDALKDKPAREVAGNLLAFIKPIIEGRCAAAVQVEHDQLKRVLRNEKQITIEYLPILTLLSIIEQLERKARGYSHDVYKLLYAVGFVSIPDPLSKNTVEEDQCMISAHWTLSFIVAHFLDLVKVHDLSEPLVEYVKAGVSPDYEPRLLALVEEIRLSENTVHKTVDERLKSVLNNNDQVAACMNFIQGSKGPWPHLDLWKMEPEARRKTLISNVCNQLKVGNSPIMQRILDDEPAQAAALRRHVLKVMNASKDQQTARQVQSAVETAKHQLQILQKFDNLKSQLNLTDESAQLLIDCLFDFHRLMDQIYKEYQDRLPDGFGYSQNPFTRLSQALADYRSTQFNERYLESKQTQAFRALELIGVIERHHVSPPE